MEDKRYPVKEANRLSKLLDMTLPATVRYPVDVKMVAMELTPSFNDDPITAVSGDNIGKAVDGMLVKHPDKNEWAIFYNTEVAHSGRVNFTLAHELGHYMVHRHVNTTGLFKCGDRDMLSDESSGISIETEANVFANNLLMPNHSFRAQIEGQPFSIDLIEHCANYYNVSLTATVLKWLDLTTRRAIALLSEDGFMHWSKSSKKAFKSGRYFATKQHLTEVPEQSAAATQNFSTVARAGIRQGAGIWFDEEEVIEHSIYSAEYNKTFTILVMEDL